MRRVQTFRMGKPPRMARALGIAISRCELVRLRRDDWETPMVKGWKLAFGCWVWMVDVWLTVKEVPE